MSGKSGVLMKKTIEILKALENCTEIGSDCSSCPYYKDEECIDALMRDAKAQLQKDITLLETDDFVVKYNGEKNEYVITHFNEYHWDGAIHLIPNEKCWEE